MDSRSAYRLQLLDKLGSPLAAALPAGMDGEKAAETMASLIGKSVQLGLMLAQKMKLADEDTSADSVRLSLAALSAPLLAAHYKNSGKVPDDAALEKLAKGLEATLVFGENFTAAQEHTARLKSLHEPLPLFDGTQLNILILNAIVPALGAVQRFSFGQSEGALIKDVADRLGKTATRLVDGMITGEQGDKDFAKLTLLRALSEIYAGVHTSHTQKAEKAGGETAPGLDAVWKDFDEQVAMIEVLTGMAVPPPGSSSAAPQPQTTPSQAPAQPAAASAQAGGNPMSFFKKPGSEPAAPAAPSQSAPPPAAPAQSAPPAPAAEKPSNPMSFFKKPTDGDQAGE